MSLLRAVAAVLITFGALVPAVGAEAAPAPPAVLAVPADYCVGQCDDILPPGQNGQATFTEILAFQTLGIRPPHSSDTRATYERLIWNYTGLTDDQIQRFFTDASFGVPADQVESRITPHPEATIVRDRARGIPHVTGTTRYGTMFGAGYAGAQDRLFLMDVLRHVGRGQLTPFAGGAQGNRDFEQQQWRTAPYTEADLQSQIDRLDDEFGAPGRQLQLDLAAYVDGVNAYVNAARSGGTLPGEYTLLGSSGPDPWRATDVIATATLVGGIFGGGGGGEVVSAVALVEAQARYGATLGRQVWEAFRSQNDPEAPTTVHNGTTFPYLNTPADPVGRALPDLGSVVPQPVVVNPSGSGTTTSGERGLLPDGFLREGAAARGMSNALLVSAQHSDHGHPIAVYGPQTGYFAPQLLLVQELQGPGISARGAAFAGINFSVLLGRGQDYSWSATSAGQDITDTYAVRLCEPDGRPPTLQSMHYLFRGQCLPMEVLRRQNSWSPSLADPTPAGSYTLEAQRTKLGLVSHRGTVAGAPVAFTRLRSTYFREANSALGFTQFSDPAVITSAQAFQQAAHKIGFAFNWFYTDSAHIAYFNSGDNPVRAAGADPHLPTWGDPGYEWQGWNPITNVASYTPFAAHPQVVDQDYLTNWNNKQAPAYSAADGNFGFSSVHRSEPLDDRIRAVINRGERFSRAELVSAMADAATVDLRGDKVLPSLLRVLDSQAITDPALANAAQQLRAWQQAGSHRRSPAEGTNYYDHSMAIQLMDAWWPRLVPALFGPSLGDALYGSLTGIIGLDNKPGPNGSAYQDGWYGYVEKDLRAVLGDPVAGANPVRFCGGGALAACRTVLLDTLRAALDTPPGQVYPGLGGCAAADQYCHDQIAHQAIGGITQERTHWMNRPTFQQAVQFPARRGDDVSNLALGRPATASSTEWNPFVNLSPGRAVDGDRGTRWASARSDPQWLRVDLGSSRPVARVVLRWEAAYARAFRIDVSADGVTWRTVASTSNGDGGLDEIAFTPTTARYVRMYGTARATSYGYSLYELEVYSH
ncbi:MAG TPA: penicillin acylase family protein [Pseudonocardiaceae bacterium]|nr:penicillin acylase family protein [Pseudonocardiaceae bacterium]